MWHDIHVLLVTLGISVLVCSIEKDNLVASNPAVFQTRHVVLAVSAKQFGQHGRMR